VLYPVVGALAAGWAGLAWSLVGMVFTVAIPAGIVDLGVRQGRYTDHHLSRREQRAVPLGLSAASVLAGLAVLAFAGAPRAIVALQVSVLVTLLVVTAVTVVWKVSLHVAVVGAAACVLTLLGGGWWALSWLAVPVVGWARLRLAAHTFAQVVVGCLLGAGVTGGVLLIVGVASPP
jgi:membrane-associated phospholipid phosphatase